MIFSNLLKQKNSEETQLELFDTPEKISVRIFYKVMETNDLSMLCLNPQQLKESHAEKLTEIWNNLLDFYYRSTNKQNWENFLRNFRNVVKIQNEIIACRAALEMVQLHDSKGFEYLRALGIRSENIDAIKAAILSKETKLELAENKLKKKDDKEVFRFYKILVSVKNSTKRDIDIDKTCLAEWVEILNGIAEHNRLESEAINKQKRR